jgi:hypothetical protein
VTCTYSVLDLPERIASKIEVDENNCWLWTATQNGYGYGKLWWSGSTRRAHRVVYQLLVGEIPASLQLDHLCRVRHCVNPAHLEPVTGRENLLRGDTIPAKCAAKTHCPKGHLLVGDNLVPSDLKRGHRACLTCHRERDRAYRARQRALAGGAQ